MHRGTIFVMERDLRPAPCVILPNRPARNASCWAPPHAEGNRRLHVTLSDSEAEYPRTLRFLRLNQIGVRPHGPSRRRVQRRVWGREGHRCIEVYDLSWRGFRAPHQACLCPSGQAGLHPAGPQPTQREILVCLSPCPTLIFEYLRTLRFLRMIQIGVRPHGPSRRRVQRRVWGGELFFVFVSRFGPDASWILRCDSEWR